MSFTPRPNTGSTWWITRLRAAGTRAAVRRRQGALFTRPSGPLIRPLAPGEGSPFTLSLTPSERARLDQRISPNAPPLARAVVAQQLDVGVARSGKTAAHMIAVVGPTDAPVIATSNASDVYNPTAEMHDNTVDMGGFTERTNDAAAPATVTTPDPATGDTDGDTGGGVR